MTTSARHYTAVVTLIKLQTKIKTGKILIKLIPHNTTIRLPTPGSGSLFFIVEKCKTKHRDVNCIKTQNEYGTESDGIRLRKMIHKIQSMPTEERT